MMGSGGGGSTIPAAVAAVTVVSVPPSLFDSSDIARDGAPSNSWGQAPEDNIEPIILFSLPSSEKKK